jgi:aspartate racemase
MNRRVREHLGGSHSAKCIIYSFDLEDIVTLQHSGDWDQAGKLMASAAATLKNAQVDAILICTNTMHKFATTVESTSGLPLLHIADATAERVKSSNIRCVGLLGTRFTMEEEFYKSRLIEKHNLQVIIPEEDQREVVHRIIYDELCKGIISDESRSAYVAIIESMAKAGAEGIILGCTEIGLLVRPVDVSLPLFDTTVVHAEVAADWALSA